MLFQVPDITGHQEFSFDPKNAAELEAAMATFMKLVKPPKGEDPQGVPHTAFEKLPDGGSRVLRKFNPDAETVVFVRPLAGG